MLVEARKNKTVDDRVSFDQFLSVLKKTVMPAHLNFFTSGSIYKMDAELAAPCVTLIDHAYVSLHGPTKKLSYFNRGKKPLVILTVFMESTSDMNQEVINFIHAATNGVSFLEFLAKLVNFASLIHYRFAESFTKENFEYNKENDKRFTSKTVRVDA